MEIISISHLSQHRHRVAMQNFDAAEKQEKKSHVRVLRSFDWMRARLSVNWANKRMKDAYLSLTAVLIVQSEWNEIKWNERASNERVDGQLKKKKKRKEKRLCATIVARNRLGETISLVHVKTYSSIDEWWCWAVAAHISTRSHTQ